MQSDLSNEQLLHELCRNMRKVLELLAQRRPQPDDEMLAAVLGRLAVRGLPVQFTLAELQAARVITDSEAHRLRYALKGLLQHHGGLIAGLHVVKVAKCRNVWLYELRRM